MVDRAKGWQGRKQAAGNVGTALHLAPGDSGSIPTRLVDRRRQVGGWDVGHPIGAQPEAARCVSGMSAEAARSRPS
jgi:hypothetical protein